MVLVLDDAAVRQAIDMAEAVAAIEAACQEQAAGQAVYADRLNMRVPGGWMRLMPAALYGSDVIGYKEFHAIRHPGGAVQGVRYAVHLFAYSTGAPLAQLDANHLTAIRTGAAAGVAAKYLAPADATTLGVLGSGAEARTEIEAITAVRPIRHIKVYSRDPERRARFAREMSAHTGIEITPVDRPEAAIDEVEILAVATNTGTTGPALYGQWLRRGLHVNSIGSTMAEQRELDVSVWSVPDRIVLDTLSLLEESGDGIAAREAGTVDERKVVELSAVVAGQVPGRTSAAETTLYKSVGTALQDVAVGYRIYQQARARGLGREVEDYQSVKGA